MSPRRALLLPIVALAGAGAAWFTHATPRTEPRIGAAVANSVTSFPHGHPEWDLLAEPRRDSAAIRLNHARHLDPTAPGMQDLLRGLVLDPDAHVRTVSGPEGNRLSLSCASCHAPDDARAYMRPISFEAHCARCHENQLVRVPAYTAGGEEGARVPHGDAASVVLHIERSLASRAAVAESRFAPADAPAEDGGRTSSRGRRGAASADVPAFQSREEALAWLGKERSKFLVRAQTGCAYCHTRVSGADSGDGVFTVEPPAIPEAWLPNAWFSHNSHEMLACTACHTHAASSTDTADIMIPGVESCRECHSPSAGAPSNCTVCHAYHMRSPYLEGGGLLIEEFKSATHGAPSGSAAE